MLLPTRAIRPITRQLTLLTTRPFSILHRRMAEGDTGSIRSGGQRSADAWSKREKASEDMYIYEREKEIMALMKEKIAKQTEQLAKDQAILSAMENQYGHVDEGRTQ